MSQDLIKKYARPLQQILPGIFIEQPPVLPPRALSGVFHLEQNLGCELPVCASNRSAVRADAIEFEMLVDGHRHDWRLVRSATSLLPAPEHYRFWLWFLDKCMQAKEVGVADHRPSIEICPHELHALFGGTERSGGSWYTKVDEAFCRFSSLHLSVCSALRSADGRFDLQRAMGMSLMLYVSHRRKTIVDPELKLLRGHAVPSEFLWANIRRDYVLRVPIGPLRRLEKYIAQRLYTYLCRHCRPGGEYTVRLARMLPKLPYATSEPSEARRAFAEHHQALVEAGFLAELPVFAGRKAESQVTYRRL